MVMKCLSTAILFPNILLIILPNMPDFEDASMENRKHIIQKELFYGIPPRFYQF